MQKDVITRMFIVALLVISISKGELTLTLMTRNLQAPHLQDTFQGSILNFIFVNMYGICYSSPPKKKN